MINYITYLFKSDLSDAKIQQSKADYGENQFKIGDYNFPANIVFYIER